MRTDCCLSDSEEQQSLWAQEKNIQNPVVLTDMVENTNVKGDSLGNVWEAFVGSSARQKYSWNLK